MKDLSPKLSDFVKAGFDPYGPAESTTTERVGLRKALRLITSWPARAAVILLLFTGGAAAGPAVLPFLGIQYSSETLGYSQALQILSDTGSHPSDKRSAQSRVYILAAKGIAALRNGHEDDGPLGTDAEIYLNKLREELDRDE